MSHTRTRISLLVILLGALLLAAAVLAPAVYARWNTAAAASQVSPLHPTFALLDQAGQNVLESGAALSTLRTCGQCHDTAYITSHSFHSDLGYSAQVPAGQSASGRPWDTSAGLYGRWNPLTYRLLSPAGDSRTDLDTAAWLALNAERIAGGGPAAELGVEMNCFLCHFETPNNPSRAEAIRQGQYAWSSAAALLGSGIVYESGAAYTYNRAAFTEDGELDRPYVLLQDPTNDACAQCHGVVHSDKETILTLAGCETQVGGLAQGILAYPQTATTGQVISGQRISLSGLNLADKETLSRSWDIHAERGLQCVDCHYSLNNPALYQSSADSRPGHLEFDPRRLEIGEYLQKPDHNFARGQSAQFTVAPELKGSMRRCESCHDSASHADWLPYVERHMAEVTCETCHIQQLYAPAIQMVDWTVLTAGGDPLSACRGVEGESGTLNDLVTGFQPVLLQRSDIDGNTALAPYNLVSAWFWVYDSPQGERPVPLDDLHRALFENGAYAQQVLASLDADGDGDLATAELRLDSDAKVAVVAARLGALGLVNPRIQGEVQPYSINHNVARGEWAVRECASCHDDASQLAAPLELSSYLPGGVLPAFVRDANTQALSDLQVQDGALVYQPDLSKEGVYVFGHSRVSWIDWLGALFFVGVLAAVGGHGGLRAYHALRKPQLKGATRRVYMYSVYERFWHWLQTLAIILLLLTGLVIHRPDMFGWLSFRYMVTLHNVLAGILVVNAALSLFYHLVSGEIRQFIPRPYGFFDQAIVQAKFYMQGIFKGAAHPFEKTPNRKMNPLQQVTYFGILNVLLPLQILTGALMWGVQLFPTLAGMLGGLPFLSPFHSLVAWTFGAFIVAHVYLTTTGHEPLTGIKAMVNGWEETAAHTAHDAPAAESTAGTAPGAEPAPAD